jgi:cellulose synthase/poly-beta-1,6-N-acetylglucosamine synthase-like glycosyltransferase
MFVLELLFILSLAVIVFVYALYGPIMMVLRLLKGKRKMAEPLTAPLPGISLIIPAYNEEGWIRRKIENSLSLNYPKDKLEIIVVTDGSTDGTNKIASEYMESIMLLHQSARNGKIKAMDRAARIANKEILLFTDANTDLNSNSLIYIAHQYADTRVGMVAGEKKVMAQSDGESANAEGLYWKYESWLKQLDSDVSSVIGAAGELFSIRADLYDSMPDDTILDDFMLSSRVVELGYRVAYEPRAFAIEFGSASYKEEWKRKVRICTGGIQSVIRSRRLFDFSSYGLRSFSFLVHRVSRWTLAPGALALSYFSSGMLASTSPIYSTYFMMGSLALALTYFAVQENLKNLPKPLLLIVYFTFMHLSALAGWYRYFSRTQSVNWERAARLA